MDALVREYVLLGCTYAEALECAEREKALNARIAKEPLPPFRPLRYSDISWSRNGHNQPQKPKPKAKR